MTKKTKKLSYFIFQFIVIVIYYIYSFLEIFFLFECRSTLDIEIDDPTGN